MQWDQRTYSPDSENITRLRKKIICLSNIILEFQLDAKLVLVVELVGRPSVVERHSSLEIQVILRELISRQASGGYLVHLVVDVPSRFERVLIVDSARRMDSCLLHWQHWPSNDTDLMTVIPVG